MLSLSLRNCAIVAALLVSVSAKATLIDNLDLDIGEEDRPDKDKELEERRAQTSRIVGGNQATKGEYPYFVQWMRGCGASLIHADIVLTAAHCNGNSVSTSVIVSAYQNGKAIDGGLSRTIAERVLHPKYNSNTEVNDFMIMRLSTAVTGVTPIALNANAQIPAAGDVLTVMGFGDLKDGGEIYPTFLQEVNVPFVTHSKCNQQYGGRIDQTSMLCAGYDQGGKDSCQGDSGGPIVRVVNGVHTQVGVVSWGDGCALANKPGVYARTSAQIKWIQSEVCRLTRTNPKPAYCSGTTTASPTASPILASPTSSPTKAPTKSPILASPTSPPSKAPTPVPTPASGSVCVDDSTATFVINGRVRTCAWFASRPTAQENYCGWDSDPDYYCQKTCDSCLYWQGDRSKTEDVCEDSTNKFWINDRLGLKTCAWLATQESWQNKMCGWDTEADFECQSTCNSCEYWRNAKA